MGQNQHYQKSETVKTANSNTFNLRNLISRKKWNVKIFIFGDSKVWQNQLSEKCETVKIANSSILLSCEIWFHGKKWNAKILILEDSKMGQNQSYEKSETVKISNSNAFNLRDLISRKKMKCQDTHIGGF